MADEREFGSRGRDWFFLGAAAGALYSAARNPGGCACCLVILLILGVLFVVAVVALVQALWWVILLIAAAFLLLWALRQALLSYDRRRQAGLPSSATLLIEDIGYEGIARVRHFWLAGEAWGRRNRGVSIILVLVFTILLLKCT